MVMKTFFITCLFSLIAFSGYSEQQPQQERQQVQKPQQNREKPQRAQRPQTQEERQAFRQKVQAHRVAFFSERLSLTPAEAEKFWPLYNTYQNHREKLIRETNQKTQTQDSEGKPEFDVSNLSDDEAKQLVGNKTKQIELEMKFHNDLIKLFSSQRVLMFYDAERSFQRKLMNARSRGGHGGGRPDGTRPNPRERSRPANN
jgi:cell fate regulator YaaT (PSP1 superfamily)